MSSIKKNFAYQSFYQILTMILPLITAPYIARVLGAENVGIFSYTYTIANYFVVFAMLGLETYGNRSIAKVRNNSAEKNRVFSELLAVHLAVSVLCIIAYFIYVALWAEKYQIFFMLQGIYVLSAVFDISWFFFGMEEFKITVVRNTFVKLLAVILIFLLVKTSDDLWIYVLIMSSSYLIGNLTLWGFVSNRIQIQKVAVSACIQHLKPILLLFTAVIATNVYRMIDKVMLGNMGLITELAYYEYADKIVRIPLSLITSFGTVMLSRMSNMFSVTGDSEIKKTLQASAIFVIVLSYALAFGIAGIAPEFSVLFLGNHYAETGTLIMILAISLPIIAWNNFVRMQILIPMQMEKIFTRAVISGACVSVVLNLILIPLFECRGSACASILSYSVVWLVQTIPVWNHVKSFFRYVWYPLLSGGIMFWIVRLIGNWLGISFIGVVLQVTVGAVVYLCLICGGYMMKRFSSKNHETQN